jgi:ABC-2 type transport system ATP-binding protein
MEEIERIADNLILLEDGRLRHMSAPEAFCERVTYWIADIPFKGPPHGTIPGLMEARTLDGLQHYLVLDQDETFAEFLRAAGARSINAMPVSLDRAVNAFLSMRHAAPPAH